MHFYVYVPDHCVCASTPQYISEEGGMEIWVHFSVPVVNFCPSEAVCTSPLSEARAFVPVSVSICEFVCECACPGVRLLAAGHGL